MIIKSICQITSASQLSLDIPESKNVNRGAGETKNGSIKLLTGPYKDATVTINDGEELLIGRDAQKCQLIFDDSRVSRVHCSVRYSAKGDKYYITDYSKNGTYFKGGRKLIKEYSEPCRRGTALVLGKSQEEFLVI